MPTAEFVFTVIFAGGFLSFGILFGIIGLKKTATIATILWTATSRGSDSSDGFVGMEGKSTSSSDPLVAPFSGEECLYYASRIIKWESTGQNGRKSVALARDESNQPFSVENEAGRVEVAPNGANRFLRERVHRNVSGDQIPREIRDALSNATYDFDPVDFTEMKVYGIREQYVAPGDRVFVHGVGKYDPETRASLTVADRHESGSWIPNWARDSMVVAESRNRALLSISKSGIPFLIGGIVMTFVGIGIGSEIV